MAARAGFEARQLRAIENHATVAAFAADFDRPGCDGFSRVVGCFWHFSMQQVVARDHFVEIVKLFDFRCGLRLLVMRVRRALRVTLVRRGCHAMVLLLLAVRIALVLLSGLFLGVSGFAGNHGVPNQSRKPHYSTDQGRRDNDSGWCVSKPDYGWKKDAAE